MERDIPKCKFHPSQPITNYCTQVSCYVELCAKCICGHTNDHNLINTKPKYEHIKDIYQITNERLCKLRQAVSHEKARVANIFQKIKRVNSQCSNFLKQARQDAILTVNKAFDELEINFTNHIQQEKQKSGLLNQGRLDQVFSDLSHQTIKIHEIIQQLNSFRNPNIIKIANNQFLPEAEKNLRLISQEMSINDQFQPNISYRPAMLVEVSAAAKKLISTAVSYTVPNNEYYRKKSISRPKYTELKHFGTYNCSRQVSVRKSKAGLQLKSPKMASTAGQNYYQLQGKENFYQTR